MNRYFAILFATIIAILSGRTMAQQTSEQLGRGFHVVTASSGIQIQNGQKISR